MDTPIQRAVGSSTALAKILDQVSDLAAINRPVLILGQRGTGKELIAERLHYLSQRWDQPFIKVNCAAISDQLLESELFGHEPGAFTGATRVHHGRFERADGGSLFLDELGTMSTRLQEKLLRLIEYGEFERLGGQKTQTVDVRIIAATNSDLRKMAEQGDFRDDLLDRLAFDVVHVPPLKFRKEDIPELADFFAVRMSHELGWTAFPGFSPQAMDALHQYDWPGNIRELRNAIERSVFRWGVEDLAIEEVWIDPFQSPFEEPPSPTKNQSNESAPIPGSEGQDKGLKERIHQFEKDLVSSALTRNHFHQRTTATELGLSYDQLRGLLKKHNLGKGKGVS